MNFLHMRCVSETGNLDPQFLVTAQVYCGWKTQASKLRVHVLRTEKLVRQTARVLEQLHYGLQGLNESLRFPSGNPVQEDGAVGHRRDLPIHPGRLLLDR